MTQSEYIEAVYRQLEAEGLKSFLNKLDNDSSQ